jgi:hypothetical protein
VGVRHAFRLRQAREHAILRHPDGRILELGEACLDIAFSLQNLLVLEDVVFDGAVAPVAVAIEVIEQDAVPLVRRIPWLRTETPLMGRHVSGCIGGLFSGTSLYLLEPTHLLPEVNLYHHSLILVIEDVTMQNAHPSI